MDPPPTSLRFPEVLWRTVYVTILYYTIFIISLNFKVIIRKKGLKKWQALLNVRGRAEDSIFRHQKKKNKMVWDHKKLAFAILFREKPIIFWYVTANLSRDYLHPPPWRRSQSVAISHRKVLTLSRFPFCRATEFFYHNLHPPSWRRSQPVAISHVKVSRFNSVAFSVLSRDRVYHTAVISSLRSTASAEPFHFRALKNRH